jgi:LysR family transcriptional regulator, regulator for bpeEF and oprC
MDRFNAMKVFTRVVEANSFSRAADTLNLTRASVTTIIQALESDLNVRLLQRTTRSLNLTPDGAAYYEACVRILADVEETESSFASVGVAPKGRLRVDMPGLIGTKIIMPKLDEFHSLYPGIQVLIGFSDKPVDLIQDGVDCVIRVGALPDSSLVARKVGLFAGVTAASPGYLERHGIPETIDDLSNHTAVLYFSALTGRIGDLNFVTEGKQVNVKMAGHVAFNDAESYIKSGVAGAGLIQIARFMALPYLRSGQLVEVLPDAKPQALPVSLVYPHNRHLSPKVRAFVDWVAELFARCPLLSGGTNPLIEEMYFSTLSPLTDEQRRTVNVNYCEAMR